MSDSTNSVFDRVYEAVREFQEHPQGMFVNTSRGRELGMMNGAATVAMRVLLTELLEQVRSCGLKGENVPGFSGSFGPEGEAYNEGVYSAFMVVETILKELGDA